MEDATLRRLARQRSSRWWPLIAIRDTVIGAGAFVLLLLGYCAAYCLWVIVPLAALYALVQFVKWAWMH